MFSVWEKMFSNFILISEKTWEIKMVVRAIITNNYKSETHRS